MGILISHGSEVYLDQSNDFCNVIFSEAGRVKKIIVAFLAELARSLVVLSVRVYCLIKKLFKIWNIIVTMDCWNISYFKLLLYYKSFLCCYYLDFFYIDQCTFSVLEGSINFIQVSRMKLLLWFFSSIDLIRIVEVSDFL